MIGLMKSNLNHWSSSGSQMKLRLTIIGLIFVHHISEINKTNKGKSKEPHTAGSKTFARVIHEEIVEKKRNRPTRAEVYIKTRFSQKTGDYVTPEASMIAEAMKADLEAHGSIQSDGEKMSWEEDVYSKHKGTEKKGRIRCKGKIQNFEEAESSNKQKVDPCDQEIKGLYNMIFCLADFVKDLCPNFSLEKALEDGKLQVSTGASGILKDPFSSKNPSSSKDPSRNPDSSEKN